MEAWGGIQSRWYDARRRLRVSTRWCYGSNLIGSGMQLVRGPEANGTRHNSNVSMHENGGKCERMRTDLLKTSYDERNIGEDIASLKRGACLLKYGHRGKPNFCPFRLSNLEGSAH
ncbi:E3 ubiquitin-protein ligase HERC1 [Artemisia annua]|uniref:E3 ubiquitin-protein ligase HERC1 n=1 Tax=Artemisia annua TaxID=35608 RepID=A0A2U1MCZ9_ARTAN|nr:E3 ubiquitin-protein ligase HERC1 [Artemisia annua]